MALLTIGDQFPAYNLTAVIGGDLYYILQLDPLGAVAETNELNNAIASTALAQRCAEDSNLTLFGSNYQDVFAFLVLIAVLIFRPSGLLGERVSDRA